MGRGEPSLCVRTWRSGCAPRRLVVVPALLLAFFVVVAVLLVNLWAYDTVTGQPLCPADNGALFQRAASHFKLRTPALEHINLHWMKTIYGELSIWAAQSSVTREDTTDAFLGGLSERRRRFGEWIDDLLAMRPIVHNYLKVLDRPTVEQLDEVGLSAMLPLGRHIEQEIRLALHNDMGLQAPESAGWSLWIGANGSTTSLHVDDHCFNLLLVLSGVKRFVLIDPDVHEFPCERPLHNPNACWAGIDVLTGTPPTYAREVFVRRGEAILLSEMVWHAVENVGPTIAVGLNEHPDCTGRRFAALQRSPKVAAAVESGVPSRPLSLGSSLFGARVEQLRGSWLQRDEDGSDEDKDVDEGESEGATPGAGGPVVPLARVRSSLTSYSPRRR